MNKVIIINYYTIMAALKTNTFKTLYKHFVAQTSRARPAIAERQLEEITTYPSTE